MDLDLLPALEESLWRAGTRFDPAYCERVLHRDWFEFGRSGKVWTREEALAMSGGEIRAELRDLRATEVSPGVALVTYVSVVEHDDVQVSNRSSLWVWGDGRWQQRFHQGTPAT